VTAQVRLEYTKLNLAVAITAKCCVHQASNLAEVASDIKVVRLGLYLLRSPDEAAGLGPQRTALGRVHLDEGAFLAG
jgi:hypothetical protein